MWLLGFYAPQHDDETVVAQAITRIPYATSGELTVVAVRTHLCSAGRRATQSHWTPQTKAWPSAAVKPSHETLTAATGRCSLSCDRRRSWPRPLADRLPQGSAVSRAPRGDAG